MTTPDPAWPGIYKFTIDDPVQGGPDGIDNLPLTQLEVRTDTLRDGQEAQAGQITQLETNLTNLTTIVQASQAEAVAGVLRAQLAGQAVYVEAFSRGWSLIDTQGRGGPLAALALTEAVVPVAGDDSLDVSSTAGLIVGDPYVLFNGDGYRQEIRVTEILGPNRIRIAPALAGAVTLPASLGRTDWDVSQPNRAEAAVGAVYLSPALDLGTGTAARALVVRHAPGADILLEWRDGTRPAWVDSDWHRRRTVDVNTVETQYLLPAHGPTYLRLVGGVGGTVYGLTTQNAAALPEGTYNARPRPRVAVPVAGATDVSPLTALALADYPVPPSVAAASAVWELWEPDATAAAWIAAALPVTATPVLSAPPLTEGAAYRLRARVILDGTPTEWSRWVDFTASDNFKRPLAPTITSPSAATPADLGSAIVLSAFNSPDQDDVHTGTQVMLRPLASASWADPVWDSGTLSAATAPALPMALDYGAPYLLRARQRGLVGGWSPWSEDRAFQTRAPEWWITQVGDTVWTAPKAGLFDIAAIGGGASGNTWGPGGGSGYIEQMTVPLLQGQTVPVRVGRGGMRTPGAVRPGPSSETVFHWAGEPTVVGDFLIALGGNGVPFGAGWPTDTSFYTGISCGRGGSYGGGDQEERGWRDGFSDGGGPPGSVTSGVGVISRLDLIPGRGGRGIISAGQWAAGGAGGIVPANDPNLRLALSGAGSAEGAGLGYGAGGGGELQQTESYPAGAPGVVIIRFRGA